MHILITGKPRTGKTTLLKRFTKDFHVSCGGFYTEEISLFHLPNADFDLRRIFEQLHKLRGVGVSKMIGIDDFWL